MPLEFSTAGSSLRCSMKFKVEMKFYVLLCYFYISHNNNQMFDKKKHAKSTLFVFHILNFLACLCYLGRE